MTVTRQPLGRTDLAPLTRAALGPARILTAVSRLRGGTKKGVYRLAFEDGATAVAYVWSAAEDYWDAGPSDPRDPFSHATGLDLFTAAHDRLAAAGVRTPRLLYADATHTHLPADAAIVEDLNGGSLEALLSRDARAAPRAMERFAELLATLHAVTGPRFGKVALVDSGGSSHDQACARRVTAPCARSRRWPYATRGSVPYGRNWQAGCGSWPPRSAPGRATPSYTANSARTTSC
ncbi:phosphotransferase [Streptomyces sp. HD]|uniref:phosphotransferase n=1 Tax=Streptomyces sp. HD TaxID=3020892 RepID=UPI002FEE25FA